MGRVRRCHHQRPGINCITALSVYGACVGDWWTHWIRRGRKSLEVQRVNSMFIRLLMDFFSS